MRYIYLVNYLSSIQTVDMVSTLIGNIVIFCPVMCLSLLLIDVYLDIVLLFINPSSPSHSPK